MDDLFYYRKLDQSRSLCLSTLARETLEENNALHLGGDDGYFIYETLGPSGPGGINVLAKAASWEAAIRLLDLYEASLLSRTARRQRLEAVG